MIKVELTPNEALWIFERVLREKAKAIPAAATAKRFEESSDPEKRKLAEDFHEIMGALDALAEKMKAGLGEYLEKNPEEENGEGGVISFGRVALTGHRLAKPLKSNEYETGKRRTMLEMPALGRTHQKRVQDWTLR